MCEQKAKRGYEERKKENKILRLLHSVSAKCEDRGFLFAFISDRRTTVNIEGGKIRPTFI